MKKQKRCRNNVEMFVFQSSIRVFPGYLNLKLQYNLQLTEL